MRARGAEEPVFSRAAGRKAYADVRQRGGPSWMMLGLAGVAGTHTGGRY